MVILMLIQGSGSSTGGSLAGMNFRAIATTLTFVLTLSVVSGIIWPGRSRMPDGIIETSGAEEEAALRRLCPYEPGVLRGACGGRGADEPDPVAVEDVIVEVNEEEPEKKSLE